MPSETPGRGAGVSEWHNVVEQVAGALDLRVSNLSVAMAAEMGVPATGEPDNASDVLILWSTERRPIFVCLTQDHTLELLAKILEPVVEFGPGSEMSEEKIESMSTLAQGIAFMVGGRRAKVVRRQNDIEAVSRLGGAESSDARRIADALRDLMIVQNVFRQWLNGELTDPVLDLIACNYVLSKAP